MEGLKPWPTFPSPSQVPAVGNSINGFFERVARAPGYNALNLPIDLTIVMTLSRRDSADVDSAGTQDLLDLVPSPLWREDWSVIDRRLEALRAGGVVDFRAFLEADAAAVVELAESIRFLDVNQDAVDLYGASSKAELLEWLQSGRLLDDPRAEELMIDSLVTLAAGRRRLTNQIVTRATDGRRIDVVSSLTFYTGSAGRLLAMATVVDVTEQERTARAHRTLIRNSLAGLAIFQDGHVVFANDTAADICGRPVEQLVAMAADEIDTMVHSEDRDRVNALAAQRIRGEPVSPRSQFRIRRPDGSVRWIEESSILVEHEGRLATQVSVVDITKRREAEVALRLTQFAVDRAGDAAYWLTPDGRIFYVNAASSRMLGYSRDELTRMSVFDISDGLTPEGWRGRWQATLGEAASSFESRHRRKDGVWVPVEVTANPVELDDGQQYVCAFVRDISDRKRAEEERLRFERQLQQTQKLESLGILAGGIAHDFNNLLTGILGNASLASPRLLPDSAEREAVEQIEIAALRAAELTSQMLAYSGRGRFKVERVDLSALVREMTSLLSVSISKRATVQYDLPTDLPAIVVDATQVRQVVMNLITNASDALGSGAGVIALRAGVREVGRDFLASTFIDDDLPAGAYVFVAVEDSGAGMDANTRTRLFDPFFSTKFTGRGLGLAAVLGIVRGHGGAIHVSSVPERGTTMTVLFPKGPEVVIEPGDGDVDAHAGWKGTGTVLVVDDDPTVRDVGSRC
jgi:PAS domain S-box-containing protein